MGLDWVADHEYDIIEKCMQIEDEASYGVWTTKDGTQIPVEDMTTSHIQNTIAFIKRTDQTDMYLPWIEVFEEELERRESEE